MIFNVTLPANSIRRPRFRLKHSQMQKKKKKKIIVANNSAVLIIITEPGSIIITEPCWVFFSNNKLFPLSFQPRI